MDTARRRAYRALSGRSRTRPRQARPGTPWHDIKLDPCGRARMSHVVAGSKKRDHHGFTKKQCGAENCQRRDTNRKHAARLIEGNDDKCERGCFRNNEHVRFGLLSQPWRTTTSVPGSRATHRTRECGFGRRLRSVARHCLTNLHEPVDQLAQTPIVSENTDRSSDGQSVMRR